MKKLFIAQGFLAAALVAFGLQAAAESDAIQDPQTGTKKANSSTSPTAESEGAASSTVGTQGSGGGHPLKGKHHAAKASKRSTESGPTATTSDNTGAPGTK